MKNYKYRSYFILVLLLAGVSVYSYARYAHGEAENTPQQWQFTVIRPADFEKAWQEAAASLAYSFTCKISADSVKVKGANTVTQDQQKLIGTIGKAITLYKDENTGMLLGSKKQIYSSQSKFNSLGVLDALIASGQFTPDKAETALKTVSKKTAEIALDGTKVYLKTNGGWKTFTDADFSNQLYSSVIENPLVTGLEKNSFALKTPASKSAAAIYEGTLSSEQTISLLTPFMGAEIAKQQPLAPVKLSVTKDSHFKKFDVTDKINLGNLSFTVKETCNVSFTTPRIKIPSGAAAITKENAMNEISNAF